MITSRKVIQALNKDWLQILSLMPTDWKESARSCKAVSKRLFNFTEETMLRTILLHTGAGHSLRETSARVKASKIADVSDVSIFKALKRSEKWLHKLCKDLYQESEITLPYSNGKNMRLVDGTIVKEPGKTGSLWRINYSFNLPNLECDHFNITPVRGKGNGESLQRTPIKEGDCIIADRGYSRVNEIKYVSDNKGDIIVRANQQSLIFYNELGEPIKLLDLLSKLKSVGKAGSWIVTIKDTKGNEVKGRICAVKKNEESAKKSQLTIKKKSQKQSTQIQSTQIQSTTLEYAKYLAVFTTLSQEECSAKEVLNWYRVRWQIELAFKRLKSLAELGHLPKYDECSSRAWIYGKLLMGLLTEKLIRYSKTISPWGYGYSLQEQKT
jgi:hypothetical protein